MNPACMQQGLGFKRECVHAQTFPGQLLNISDVKVVFKSICVYDRSYLSISSSYRLFNTTAKLLFGTRFLLLKSFSVHLLRSVSC